MLESLDKEIIKRSFIETFFGKQDPSKGYQLRSITILEKGALAEVYIKDRSERDNDELRGGDLIQFLITEEDNCYAVRTDNEYETIARESKMETINDDGILTEKIQNDHQNYYKVKKNYRTKYGRAENMEYHELGNIFVCRAGRILWRIGTKHEKMKTGFVSEKALYRCESCEGCPYKQNCTKAKGNKTLAISHKFKELRAKSLENITTEFGRQLRMN